MNRICLRQMARLRLARGRSRFRRSYRARWRRRKQMATNKFRRNKIQVIRTGKSRTSRHKRQRSSLPYLFSWMAGQSLNSTQTIKKNISNSKSKMIHQAYQMKGHSIDKWESYSTILIKLQLAKLTVRLSITASFMNRIKSNNLKSSMPQETLELYQFKNNKVVLSITTTRSWKVQSPAKLIRWWITNRNCHQTSNRCSPPWAT